MENTLATYKKFLSEGVIGIVESRLKKDNSWFGEQFDNWDELQHIQERFKKDGYPIDRINFYVSTVNGLENPQNTATENLQFLISYIESISN